MDRQQQNRTETTATACSPEYATVYFASQQTDHSWQSSSTTDTELRARLDDSADLKCTRNADCLDDSRPFNFILTGYDDELHLVKRIRSRDNCRQNEQTIRLVKHAFFANRFLVLQAFSVKATIVIIRTILFNHRNSHCSA